MAKNNNNKAKQEALENKEKQKEPEDKKQEQKLFKVEVKIAKKGIKKFYRAGVVFSEEWQELELKEEQLTKVKNEKMLTVKEVK